MAGAHAVTLTLALTRQQVDLLERRAAAEHRDFKEQIRVELARRLDEAKEEQT